MDRHVAEGGTIQSRGSFSPQAAIDVAVSNGGTIDIRSMSVGSVTASVVRNAASVRIDAGTWVDYLHIARWNDRWVIVNVLWELRPQ